LLLVFLAQSVLLPALADADSRISPEFSLSLPELSEMIVTLPTDIHAGILGSPRDFLHLVAGVLDEPPDLFVLVDKKHLLASDFEPPDLVRLKSYKLPVLLGDVSLRKAIMPAVMDLAAAAKKAGLYLVFSSGYRSYKYQGYVFAREVKTYGLEMAERESAHPGASQHQLGTAMDFGSISDAFADTPEGRWLASHAEEYGFSMSYPNGMEGVTGYRYESWHFRFITRAGTHLQQKFFGDVQQYMMEFLHSNWEILAARRTRSP
jgi:D-alanyl-D-alanine carboxypeptidase